MNNFCCVYAYADNTSNYNARRRYEEGKVGESNYQFLHKGGGK